MQTPRPTVVGIVGLVVELLAEALNCLRERASGDTKDSLCQRAAHDRREVDSRASGPQNHVHRYQFALTTKAPASLRSNLQNAAEVIERSWVEALVVRKVYLQRIANRPLAVIAREEHIPIVTATNVEVLASVDELARRLTVWKCEDKDDHRRLRLRQA